MAAGLGFKTFTTGEVLTAADTNGYLMQGINVFASSAARAAAITSPQEGQYSYLKDTNALEYYDGAAWVGAPVGDITAVTAGKGLTGGGSSGDVTVSLGTTAKGDLVVGTGTTTASALTVGNNGETLVADSSTSSGLRWQAPVNVNPFLNAAMQIAQRGTSFASSTLSSAAASYTLDRWMAFRSSFTSGATMSRQATGDTTNLPFIQYCIRVARDNANISTNALWLSQSIESLNSIPYAGKTVTFSFYARAGANYSSASSALTVVLQSGTGTDQNIITTWTGGSNVVSQTATLTTTWQRFTYTGSVPSTATELGLYFTETPVGTAGAADYFEVTGVQLEVGSVATPFKTNGATIQGELAACQRYYWLWASGNGAAIGMGSNYSATQAETNVQFPVTMRVAPTLVQSTGTGYYTFQRNGGSDAFNSFTANTGTTQLINLYNNTEISGTAGNAGTMFTANASASLAFSAEL